MLEGETTLAMTEAAVMISLDLNSPILPRSKFLQVRTVKYQNSLSRVRQRPA